jgi:membrane-bound metal-dependent hydrolase YbcI (DUF457 family)
MPLPIAHGLLGASIVAATLPDASPARNWKLLLLGAALATFPDLDYFFRTEWHRGFSHSMIFASIISAACLALWRTSNIRVTIGFTGAIFSHALLDFATTKTMPGVELLWPLSTHKFGLGLVDYYHLTGIDPIFFLTKDILMDLSKAGIVEIIFFIPIFLLVLSVKWSIGNRSHS